MTVTVLRFYFAYPHIVTWGDDMTVHMVSETTMNRNNAFKMYSRFVRSDSVLMPGIDLHGS